MNRYSAYIDESGNHDLAIDKDGASSYFLVLAVIVRETEVAALECAVEKIREKYFGSGEMKSSKVNDGRRIKIIDELARLNFRFYAVAVDKSRVDRDSGLAYKKSFIKFANGRLYSALFQNLMDLSVFADGHGSPEFIQSFQKYIDENHKPDLFSQTNIEIVDSKTQVLVQLADFLVGTAAKIYEGKAPAKLKGDFLHFLGSKRTRIDEWPPRFEIRPAIEESSNALDETVRSISLQAAARFLEKYVSDSDIENRIQQASLSYLLFRATFPTDDDFIPTHELVEHLHCHGFSEVNNHYLRSNVVSKLRDRDVVIASSSRGYKIPTSYSDLVGFAELVDGIVSPLLARLERANGIFDLGSAGEIKLLDEGRFSNLQSMLAHLRAPAP